MKSLLLVLALCVLSINAATPPKCPKIACQGKTGASCKTVDQPIYTQYVCTANSYASCNYTLAEPLCVQPVVVKLLKHGSACSVDSQCEGLKSRCIEGICNLAYLPGTPCSKHTQCLFPKNDPTGINVTKCENSKCFGLVEGVDCQRDDECMPPLTCGTDGKCAKAQGRGSPCNDILDCTSSYFCNNTRNPSVCDNYIAKGQPCQTNVGLCELGATCAPNSNTTTDGTCVGLFSQKENTFCLDDTQCAKDYYCNSQRSCKKGVSFGSSSKKACTDDTECGSNELCQCDGNAVNRCFVDPNLLGNTGAWVDAYMSSYNCQTKCARTDTVCLANCDTEQCSYLNKAIDRAGFNGGSTPLEMFSQMGAPSCAVNQVRSATLATRGIILNQPNGLNLGTRGIYGYYDCSNANIVASSVLLALVAVLALLF